MKQTYLKMGNIPKKFLGILLLGAIPLPSMSLFAQQMKRQQHYSQSQQLKVGSVESSPAIGFNFKGYTPEQEIIQKRTKYSKHFINPDGSVTAQVGGNYHYKDDAGKWQNIDINIEAGNTGKSGYSFKNVKNDVKSFFPHSPSGKGVLMVLENGTEFSWWNQPKLDITSGGSVKKSYTPKQTSGSSRNEKLVYSTIYDNISEEFVVMNGGIENNTIIHSLSSELAALPSNSMLEFSQFIPLKDGWKVLNEKKQSMNSDFSSSLLSIQLGAAENTIYFGNIVVFDNNISKEDAMLIHVPADKLTENQRSALQKNVYSIRYNVKFVEGGIKIISALPVSWLKAAHRSFPVVIDPTVTVTPPNSEGYFYGPLTHWYGYQRNASLYLASEIGSIGTITGIEYNSTNTGNAGNKPTKVYMKTTPDATLSSGTWDSQEYTGGAILCLDENTDQGDTPGWKNLNLTTPFPYLQDNLIVMVYDAWGGSGSAKWYNQSTDVSSRQAYSRNDGSDPGDGASLTIEDRLTEIRITYINPVECTGLPSSITATSSETTVCPLKPFVLSLTNAPAEGGITYQWQSSTNGGTTWTNLGAPRLVASYTVTDHSVATSYRVIVTCTPTSDQITSNVVSVAISPFTSCYCINAIPLNCGDGDVITNVTIDAINNNSGCDNTTIGYSDYTSSVAPAQLQAGTTVPVSVTVGPSGDGWLYESVGIWIDYNQNGRLDSLENEYVNLGTGLDQALTGNIVIPSTALPGLTRMRVVVMASRAMQNAFACGPLLADENFGEMEDYTVNIINEALLPVDSVKVTTQGNVPATITTQSGTLQLVATVYPTTINQNVTWSTIPVTGIGSVTSSGILTAMSNGTIWVKAVSVLDPTKADSILVMMNNQGLGVNQLGADNLSIYPNPTNDFITVQSGSEHTALVVSVTDLTGKVLFRERLANNELTNEYKINLSNYASGMYILLLTGDNINVQQHIMKK